jgi:hypothetical protein
MPNTTNIRALEKVNTPGQQLSQPAEACSTYSFVNLAVEAQLAKFMHQIDTTEASAHDEHVSLQLLGIVPIIWRRRLIRGADIRSEMYHSVEKCKENKDALEGDRFDETS